MSRTKQATRTESPVQAHIFFNGDLGKFSVMQGEDSGLQELPFPLRFIVVDDGAHRITGKKDLDRDSPKFKSNIAHDAYSTRLRVWLDNDPETILGEGTWGSMSARLAPLGAKYTKLLFILTDLGQGKILACMHLKGRAFSAWVDMVKKKKIDPCGNLSFLIRGTETMAGGKGRPSLVPVFETGQLSEETKVLAEDADGVLQAWLETQFENPYTAVTPAAEDVQVPAAPPARNADPFNVPVDPRYAHTGTAGADDSDLPF